MSDPSPLPELPSDDSGAAEVRAYLFKLIGFILIGIAAMAITATIVYRKYAGRLEDSDVTRKIPYKPGRGFVDDAPQRKVPPVDRDAQ